MLFIAGWWVEDKLFAGSCSHFSCAHLHILLPGISHRLHFYNLESLCFFYYYLFHANMFIALCINPRPAIVVAAGEGLWREDGRKQIHFLPS